MNSTTLTDPRPCDLRRRLLFGAGLAALLPAKPSRAQSRDAAHSDMLLAALEIKAEAQRYAKLSAEVALGLLGSKTVRQRQAAADEMTTGVAQLTSGAVALDLQAETRQLAQQVGRLTETAKQPTESPMLLEISRLADQVTALADKLAGLIQQRASLTAGKAVALAARAMLLSQRSARDYMLIHARQDPGQTLARGLAPAKEDMDGVLEQLSAFPLGNVAIQQNLQLARLQWVLARDALAAGKLDNYSAEQVARTSERLFEVLDDLMNQYMRLMKTIL